MMKFICLIAGIISECVALADDGASQNDIAMQVNLKAVLGSRRDAFHLIRNADLGGSPSTNSHGIG